MTQTRTFHLSTLAAACLLALAPAVHAIDAPDDTTAAAITADDAATRDAGTRTLDSVVVTGSNIRRAQVEGPNPVQVITRETIETSGKSTLAEFIRALPVNTGNSADEQSTGSFSSGTANIALRGLSPKNTLILVNGYRVANFGFAQGTQDTFVDLNALPISAVDRVEVLKDGASAVYGSDAIAGVVNIILRRNFEGIEFGADYGAATQGGFDEYKGNVLAGFGDLDTDGWNVLFGLDVLLRSRLDGSERRYTRDGDFRDRPGGRLAWTTNAGAWLNNPSRPTPFDPCPEGTELRPYSDFGSTVPGDTCAFNPRDYSTLQPSAKRYQASLSATIKLGDNAEAFGDLLYSDNYTDQIFSAPLAVGPGLRAWNPETGTLVDVPSVLPVGHPNNPTNAPLPFQYNFFDIGPRLKWNKQVFYRALGGVRGQAGDWDWEAAIETSQSRQREYVDNFINRYAFEEILADGSYDFLDPGSTPERLEDLRLQTRRPGFYRLHSANFKASTFLFDLPAGAVGFATGVELRRETMDARTTPQVLSGAELRPAINIVSGTRDVGAIYSEFSVPVHETVELQLAGRADHYDDFGNAFSPKFGVRWQPTQSLLARASFSRGFRAPALPEIAPGQTVSYGSVVDPRDPFNPGGSRGITSVRTGNPDLDPERSRNFNVGLIWSPSADTTIGADWFRIEQENLINPDSAQFIVNNEDLFPGRVIRDAQGQIQIITNQYANQGERTVSGVDIELSHRIRTSVGDFTASTNWSHLLDYSEPLIAGAPAFNGAGNNRLGVLPKWKGVTTLGWKRGDWSTTLNAFYTHRYDQAVATAASAPGLLDHVKPYHQLDLHVGYSGFERTVVSLSVQNLTDKDPPFDPASTYSTAQYNLRGQFVNLGIDYRFR